ncbi:flavodoxin-dependent (E)-4-hydroxy-3-methylbut-2-enyl-diphosphate synthase [Lentisphaerota bacterium ZTH]|nr:flavodoxin-dependent (E)-4-hydroxy-3-methylbut-2-enyl-diphosphate synthase [Lentisphaerota bacterium]WET07209.1 flavodoxin-dependent (E)-4-hydroxy-3-methylbut-2-enyl-diphosphate synthase [Lentisphaerota bacterium ZTH]
MFQRRLSRQIKLNNTAVGGGAPVTVQSMTNTDTRDAAVTLRQIRELAACGCDIIRCAVPDGEAVDSMQAICSESPIPVIADIHFDYRLALGAIKSGAHGVRLNPGNIGGPDRVRQVAEAAGEAGIPIRVGANAGSVSKKLLEDLRSEGLNSHDSIVKALVHSALEQCGMLENFGFKDIKVALKASEVTATVEACRKFAAETDYPLHLGVTEAGTPARGVVKSAVGIGALLLDGIGDTIRVSLTADPVEEVLCGIRILEACGLREARPEIVSCPTCGRTEIELIRLAERVEKLVNELKASGKKINLRKIAVMGCVVNGPGEARDADLGIAGASGDKVAIFKNGKTIGVFPQEVGFERLRAEILSFSE